MKMSDSCQGTFGDFDGALGLVNDLYWNMTFRQKDNKWQLFTGDQLLATFENRGEMESFVVGMALAIGVLPPETIAQIKKFVK